MRTLSIVIILLLAGLVSAADLKLPKEVKGEAGEYIALKAETSAPVVKWVAMDAGLTFFPPELLKDTKTAAVRAKKPGKYRVLAYTGDKDGPSEPAICVVIANGEGPVDPPNPPPDDPLVVSVKADFAQETTEDKVALLVTLAGCYREAAKLPDRTEYKTAGDLVAAARALFKAKLADDALPKVRRGSIQKYQQGLLPSDPATQLTDDLRKKYRAALAKIADTLDAVAGAK